MDDKKKNWSKGIELKEGKLGPLSEVTVDQMLKDPDKVKRVSVLANLGNEQAKRLMDAYNKRKGKKEE